MQSIPLAPFLTSLAADGIRLTNRDYQRIGWVLQTEGPWTIVRLKMVLLALLAQDEEQQDVIARRFDMFFTLPSEQAEAFADIDVQQALADLQGLAQKPRVVLPPLPTLSELPNPSEIVERVTHTERRIRPWLPGIAMLIVAMLLVTTLIWFSRSIQSSPPFEVSKQTLTFAQSPGTDVTHQSVTVTSQNSKSLNLSLAITGTHQAEFRLVEVSPNLRLAPGASALITVTFRPDLSTTNSPERRAELHIGSEDHGTTQPVPMYGEISTSSGPDSRPVSQDDVGQRLYGNVTHAKITNVPQISNEWQMYAVLAGVLLLAASIYGVAVWRAHRVPNDPEPPWDPDAPRLFAVGSIGGSPGSYLTDTLLDHLADAMGFFQSEEGGNDLNIEASIRATMQNGGTPQLTFHRRKQVRSLLILEDELAEARRWNPVARELAAGIAQRGVPVLSGTFRENPNHFRTADGALHWLEDLEDQRQGYLLLIFTDGKQLCRQECAFALEELSRWPMVAWMDLREPCFWDETARIPTLYTIPIYPASADGLYLTAQRLLTEQGKTIDYTDYARTWQGPLHQHGMRFDAYIEHMLGDALLWAQSCAMLQPVSPGLADGLRRKFHIDLPPERIERLHMLPGTRRTVAGLHFSEDVLSVLRRGFLSRRHDKEQEEVLLFILHQVEQARPAQEDSLAYLAWETFRERVRLELDANNDLARLSQLAQTPLAGHINASLEHFGFPDQSDKIPLRLRLRNPAGLQRLARISSGFPIKQRDAYPVAVIHWIVVGLLLAACVGTAGWSVRQAMQRSDPTLELADSAHAADMYGMLEVRDTSADAELWSPMVPPGLPLTSLLTSTVEPAQTYRLTVYDDSGLHTAEFTLLDRQKPLIELVEMENTQQCYDDQNAAASGLIIHRCPKHTRTVVEQVDYGSWYARLQDARENGAASDRDGAEYLVSVGVEIGEPQQHKALRDQLLWTNSVDVVYQIVPNAQGQWNIEEAMQDVRQDLGPLLHHAQLIVWGDRHYATGMLRDLEADAGHLLQLRDADIRALAAACSPEPDTNDAIECIFRKRDAVLFRPVKNQGIVIVSTGDVPAAVTFSREGDVQPRQELSRNGKRVQLESGRWQMQVDAEGYALAERTIEVASAAEQVENMTLVQDDIPDTENTPLVLVANFADNSAGQYDGVDPDQYIYRALTDRIARDGLGVRVEKLDETLDENTVRETGELYGATLVLWGEYDTVGITPYIERIEESSNRRTDEEGQSVLIDPERIQFSAVTDLPRLSSYLVLFTLGATSYDAKDYATARNYLTSAIAAVPDDEDISAQPDEAYFLRGNIALFHDQEYEQAIRDYDHAIEFDPEYADAYHNRGRAYADLGEYERAIENYEWALALFRERGDRQSEARVLSNLGTVAESQGKYAEATAYYEPALVITRQLGDRQGEANVLSNLGTVAESQGNYAEARNYFEQSLALFREMNDQQGEAVALIGLGKTSRNLGEYERAIAEYDRAIELDPEDANAYTSRGIAYHNLGEYEHSIEDYTRAIELDPAYADAYHNRGRAYAELDQFVRAIEDYDRAIVLDESFVYYFNRGRLYDNLSQYELAIEDYERALPLSRELGNRQFQAFTLHVLGSNHAILDEHEQAIDYYLQALAIFRELGDRQNEARTSWDLGLSYEEQGDLELAEESIQIAADIYTEIGATEDAESASEDLERVQQAQVDQNE